VNTAGSLFDTVDVALVTAEAARWQEPGSLLIACLVEGVLGHGLDRLVVGSQQMRPTVAAALRFGWTDETAGRALAVAFGAAAALNGQGETGDEESPMSSRCVWCLLDAEACDEGGTWEAARAAAAAGANRLVACVLTPSPEARSLAALWEAAGWVVVEAAGGSPWEVLGGLDQALVIPERPVALLVVYE
jgi:transketolase N-terminal domain/subunit